MKLSDAPEAFKQEVDAMLKRVIKEQREKRKAELLDKYGTIEVYDDSLLSSVLDKNSETRLRIREELAKLKAKHGIKE
jgi:hypothetical protein